MHACCLSECVSAWMSVILRCRPPMLIVSISLSAARLRRSRVNKSLDAFSLASCCLNSSALARSHCAVTHTQCNSSVSSSFFTRRFSPSLTSFAHWRLVFSKIRRTVYWMFFHVFLDRTFVFGLHTKNLLKSLKNPIALGVTRVLSASEAHGTSIR